MPSHDSRQKSSPNFRPAQGLVLLVVGMLVVSVLVVLAFSLARPAKPLASVPATPAPPLLNQANLPARAPSAAPTLPRATPTLHPSTAPSTSIPPSPSAADCAPQNTEIRLGKVQEVISGDTLLVDMDGVLTLVGYAGISAPSLESGDPGRLALQKNSELIAGQMLVLVKDQSESDSAGRLLRYVFTTGADSGEWFVNYELVRQGYAAALDSPDTACAAIFAAAEQAARAGQVGIWQPNRVPTATFLPTVVIDSGGQAPCNCSVRYECSDFRSHAKAQACFNACNDYTSRLDDDHDGLACEQLP